MEKSESEAEKQDRDEVAREDLISLINPSFDLI